VTLPKPMTSNSKTEGRFGKQDFRYVAEKDIYICPAGEALAYSFTTEERGLVLRRYWTNACKRCAIKRRCTTAKERLVTRWEHEIVSVAILVKNLAQPKDRLHQLPDAAGLEALALNRKMSAQDHKGCAFGLPLV
jgi:hypothetical protein